MVTGASTADLALLLVDARKGVLEQPRRHSILCNLVGIRRMVLAVTKMDLVDHDQELFEADRRRLPQLRRTDRDRGMDRDTPFGWNGDNVTGRSEAMVWYSGPTLLDHLESVPIDSAADAAKPFRMAVQWVSRPDQYSAASPARSPAAGSPRRRGPNPAVGPDRPIDRIVTRDGDLELAIAGQSVTLSLTQEIDCSRATSSPPQGRPPRRRSVRATIVWMADEPMIAGRGYWLKLATQTATATIAQPKHQINVNTLEELAAKNAEFNAIGVAEITTDRPIVFEPYRDLAGGALNRVLGGFILIDKLTNATVAAGMLHFALRRAENVHWQALDVSRETHARLKAETCRAVVHRLVRRGQVDHRQPG